MRGRWFAFVLLTGSSMLAQPTPQPEPVRWTVHLDTSRAVPVSTPSVVMTISPRCREDRCYAAFATDPRHSFQQAIVAFDLKGVSRWIDLAVVPGLSQTNLLDLAPTDGGVAVLVNATLKSSGPPTAPGKIESGTPPPLTYDQQNRFNQAFLLEYDSDGKLTSSTHLSLGFMPYRLVSISRDHYLAAGLDSDHERALLATFRGDGGDLFVFDDKRFLPPWAELVKASKIMLPENASRDMQAIKAGGTISRFSLGYFRGEGVVLGMDASSLLFVRGGEVERKRLTLPQGVTASALVSSKGELVMRIFASDEDGGSLMTFDRETGRPAKLIDTSGVPGTSVFYVDDTTVYAFWAHEGKTLIVSSGRPE